jgi:hypothetical protein
MTKKSPPDELIVGEQFPTQLTDQEPDGRSTTDDGRRLLVQARRFIRNKRAFKTFLEENMLICLIKDAEDLVKGGQSGQRARDRFFDRGGLVLKRMDQTGGAEKKPRKAKSAGKEEDDASTD